MYISLYVVVNTFIGGRQPQNKLMRLRTFKKKDSLPLPNRKFYSDFNTVCLLCLSCCLLLV